ncbi:hypothetical protein AAZX31_08G327200 [Glycine max]
MDAVQNSLQEKLSRLSQLKKFRQRSTAFTLALIRLQFLSEVSDTQEFWGCFYPFFGD